MVVDCHTTITRIIVGQITMTHFGHVTYLEVRAKALRYYYYSKVFLISAQQ